MASAEYDIFRWGIKYLQSKPFLGRMGVRSLSTPRGVMPSPSSRAKPSQPVKKKEQKDRLAKALKANLLRRKAAGKAGKQA